MYVYMYMYTRVYICRSHCAACWVLWWRSWSSSHQRPGLQWFRGKAGGLLVLYHWRIQLSNFRLRRWCRLSRYAYICFAIRTELYRTESNRTAPHLDATKSESTVQCLNSFMTSTVHTCTCIHCTSCAHVQCIGLPVQLKRFGVGRSTSFTLKG